jgi:hypothetical protein
MLSDDFKNPFLCGYFSRIVSLSTWLVNPHISSHHDDIYEILITGIHIFSRQELVVLIATRNNSIFEDKPLLEFLSTHLSQHLIIIHQLQHSFNFMLIYLMKVRYSAISMILMSFKRLLSLQSNFH